MGFGCNISNRCSFSDMNVAQRRTFCWRHARAWQQLPNIARVTSRTGSSLPSPFIPSCRDAWVNSSLSIFKVLIRNTPNAGKTFRHVRVCFSISYKRHGVVGIRVLFTCRTFSLSFAIVCLFLVGDRCRWFCDPYVVFLTHWVPF